MTRSNPAVLVVGVSKGTMATQMVKRNTDTGPGGTVEMLWDVSGHISAT